MKKFALATVAAVVIAAPAQAQDGFNGFYAGVSVGYDFQANDDGEEISFDRGSNGTFGETVTTAAGAMRSRRDSVQARPLRRRTPTAAMIQTGSASRRGLAMIAR